MLKIYTYIIIACSLPFAVKSQTGIGKPTVTASAILDLSNSTSKAFLPPRVVLDNLFSTSIPVANPVEGLIVYNEGDALNKNLKGFYIWNKGAWSLLATKKNSVTNATVVSTGSVTAFLASKANGSFSPLTGGNLTFNGIPSLSYSGGAVSIPSGNYNVQVTLNIYVPDETTTGGIGGTKKTNIHYYQGQLLSGATPLGGVMADNVISNTSGSAVYGKRHTANFSFTFSVSNPTSFVFNLAHITGGTYSNGVGGSGSNNGQVTILESFIHIQRTDI